MASSGHLFVCLDAFVKTSNDQEANLSHKVESHIHAISVKSTCSAPEVNVLRVVETYNWRATLKKVPAFQHLQSDSRLEAVFPKILDFTVEHDQSCSLDCALPESETQVIHSFLLRKLFKVQKQTSYLILCETTALQ